MPDEYERLRRRIEDGLKTADELERRLAAAEREKRKHRFKVIKGGVVGGAVWAGVEWLMNPRKIALSVAAGGLAITGTTISDHPGSPSSDPPEAMKPPASVSPSVTPTPTVKPTPRPPRTSPLRTLGRSSTPVVAPTRKTVPSHTPQKAPSAVPTRTPTVSPTQTPTVSLTETPSGPLAEVPEIVETPTLPSPVTTCAVDLLGVKVCLPLGRS